MNEKSKSISSESYHSVKTTLPAVRAKIVRILQLSTAPMTANQISTALGRTDLSNDNVRARITELRTDGIVKPVGKTIDPISGKRVYGYVAANALTPETPKQSRRDLDYESERENAGE